MPLPRAGCGRPTGTADHGLLNLLSRRKVLAVGETSVPQKSRSPVTPSDSLVIYQNGKVIFRLKSPQAHGELSAPDSAVGSPRKTNVRILRRVEPDYPEAAMQQHIQGSVVLQAQVGEDGAVQHLTVISGNSMLATAASDAVLKWRFKPIVQDGRTLPFQTRVKVDFVLR